VHVQHDIAASNKFAVNVDLRDSRPRSIFISQQ
jgi:hypothetical protein